MTTPIPVVFIHGLWLHSSSWDEWVSLFREEGYAPIAPGWPGDHDTVAECRRDPESIADHGIDDIVEHYAAVIAQLPARPILVGHSVGGLLVQKLLGQDRAAAAVAIDAAQIKGVLPVPLSAVRATFPLFKNPANRHRAVSLTPEQFRYGFCNAIPAEESAALYERWTIPAPGRPAYEAATANYTTNSPAKVDTRNSGRGPLLLISGGRDHAVPESITRATLRLYGHSDAVTDIISFPDRGHSLIIDSRWREVADTALTWLRQQNMATGQ
jgi:pimeloyl-ACP methyl ester carboxylesterase